MNVAAIAAVKKGDGNSSTVHALRLQQRRFGVLGARDGQLEHRAQRRMTDSRHDSTLEEGQGVPAPRASTLPSGYWDLALVFLRLGATAFGGPAAHVALMQHEFVQRRRWLTAAEFLDLIGAASLIPGPSSTEVAIYVGYRRAGAAGLILAGTCFILPAALIVLVIAWAYVRFGTLPAMGGLLLGVKPVVVAVIAQALWMFGRTAVKSRLLALIAAAVLAFYWIGVNPLVLLGAAGAVAAATRLRRAVFSAVPAPLAVLATAAVPAMPSVAVGTLFLVFLKAGALVFGSGYVLLAFLRGDLVENLHWLTESQLVDAVAIGQVTPGPLFTTATFVGYVLHGLSGAAVATLGIFLPSFILVAVSGPFIPRLRRSPFPGAFLDGVNVASLALMAAVSVQLARASVTSVPTALIAVASLVLLLLFRLNSTWLILGGSLLGLLLGGGRAIS